MAKAKKSNQVTIAQLKSIIALNKFDTRTISFQIADGQVDIIVTPHIPVSDSLQLIVNTAAACFDDNGEYNPAVRDIAFKYAVVRYYTNVSDKADADIVSDLIAYTDFYDRLMEIIADNVDEDLDAVDRTVDYIINRKLRLNGVDSACDALVSTLSGLSNLIDTSTKNMKEEDKDISMTDIVNAAKLISQKDEKAIADAVLDYQMSKKKAADKHVEVSGTAEHQIIKPAVFKKE